MRANVKKTLYVILRAESELVLWKYKPKIVAITGSVGKTSTKDAVYSVLKEVAFVRKSEKSYNSELGLPLTVLGLPNGWNNPATWLINILKGLWLFLWPHKYPEWLVLEVGVGKPGDMKQTAGWLKSDAVIMTTISETPVHIEFFESRKHLIEEKSGLLKTLKMEGLLVLNADDEAIIAMKDKSKSRVVTYGMGEQAQVRGSEEKIFYNDEGKPNGVIFRVDEGGKSIPVIIEGVFGRNHTYASLATLALASGLKLNMLSAAQALKNHEVPPGRMRLIGGLNGSMIIDDTYNSSPFACEAALDTLLEVKAERKIAVLADMLELGKHTEEAHKKIGKLSAGIVDLLVTVGPRAEKIKEGAMEAGMSEEKILHFMTSAEAGGHLSGIIRKGDLVLVKGSQGMRMERAVGAILSPELLPNKERLLVRQEKEWLEKK